MTVIFFALGPKKLEASIKKLASEWSSSTYSKRPLVASSIKIANYVLFTWSEEAQPHSEASIYVMCGATNDRHLVIHQRASSLEISTDWAGSMPAYYFHANEGAVITSEYVLASKLLLGIGEKRHWDLYALGNVLKYSHPLGSETPNVGIKRQSVGEVLALNTLDGQLSFSRASQLARHQPRTRTKDLDELLRNFHKLNIEITRDSLGTESRILLPLSSGYDSRLVLAAVREIPELRSNVLTATYGPRDSIEVRAARELSSICGLEWHHVEISDAFLDQNYLREIGHKFGGTLHAHGMYQLLFWDLLDSEIGLSDTTVTSGFMTGVPAGQHLTKLRRFFETSERNLIGALEAFSQAKYWTDSEVVKITKDEWSREKVQNELSDLNRILSPEPDLASIQFDIFTRQSRFIAYYPDTLSLRTSVKSPHMDPRYKEYLWSLPPELLRGRTFITQYFRKFHPDLASIPSNSHQFSRLGSRGVATLILLGRALGTYLPKVWYPGAWRDVPIRFDEIAAEARGLESLWPLFADSFDENQIGWNLDLKSWKYKVETEAPHNWYQQLLGVQAFALEEILTRPR